MATLIFLLGSDVLAPLQLPTDPVGWDAIRYLWERDEKTHGVMLSASVELTFVKQAAAYLRTVYEGGVDAAGNAVEAQGVNGLVTLTVYEQNPNEFRADQIYRGRVDFTTYSTTERGVTARFIETGLATTLLTRYDSAVDLFGNESLSGISLPSYAPVVTKLHSQQTLQRFEMKQAEPETNVMPALTSDLDDSVLFFFGMDEPTLNEFNIAPFPVGPVSGRGDGPVNVPFFTAKANGVHTFTFFVDTKLKINRPEPTAANFREIDIKYEFRYVLQGAVTTISLASIHDLPPFRNQLFPGTLPTFLAGSYRISAARTLALDMRVGDTAALYSESYVHNWTNSGPHIAAVSYEMVPGSFLKISAPTTTAPTECAGLLIHEALNRCCEAVTDQRDALYSEFYGRVDCRKPYAQDGPGAYRQFTNGFMLRGFPLFSAPAPATGETDTRKTLTAALHDIYEGLDANDCLGMGLEQREGRQVVRIEPRSHFYQDSETLRLGSVTGLKKTVLTEQLYNGVEVGYSHWQSGAPNGLDEFNAYRTYSLPLTQIKKTYSIVSKVNAAGYLIEEARRDRYITSGTKEGKADNENFLIALRRNAGGWEAERDQAFVPGSVKGILSPDTSFNLVLSPGRMLKNHGPWVRVCLAAHPGKRLQPGVIEGNTHLVSQLIGEAAPLDEAAEIFVSDLPEPIALAEFYEFSVRLRRGQMEQLRRAPYGRITFLDGFGQRKGGYLRRAERSPQTGLTTFNLLRAAS